HAALRVSGEREYLVSPLALPPDGAEAPPTALGGSAAVRLFCDRARAVRAGFTLTADNAAAVAAVCRRLGGLPLALAAAPGGPVQLRERLRAGAGPLLVGGPRDAPARQRTLRHTLDWSHELLAPDERTLFARLAVFAGGFTLGAVESVCGGGPGVAGVGDVAG